jgi:DNA-binding MarR family transcriptional regulator
LSELSINDFADQIGEVMPVIMREFARRQTSELCKGKVTLQQMLILDFLSRAGSSRMTDIARTMKVTTAAATGIIDRLVKSGYCLREYNAHDRRIVYIRISNKGISLVKKVDRERRETLINTFGKISEQDRKDYLRILKQIQKVLTEK